MKEYIRLADDWIFWGVRLLHRERVNKMIKYLAYIDITDWLCIETADNCSLTVPKQSQLVQKNEKLILIVLNK